MKKIMTKSDMKVMHGGCTAIKNKQEPIMDLQGLGLKGMPHIMLNVSHKPSMKNVLVSSYDSQQYDNSPGLTIPYWNMR